MRTFKAIDINFSNPTNIKLIYNFLPIQNEVAGTDTCNLIVEPRAHVHAQKNKPKLQKHHSSQALRVTDNAAASRGPSTPGWEEERPTLVPVVEDDGISQQLRSDNHSSYEK